MKRTNQAGKGKGIFIIVLSALLMIIQTSASAQAPVANFTANVVSGCSPLVVQFSDQSTGNPTSWLWDLGNGGTSTVRNPTATYTTPGSYTIRLTVTNSSGSNSITKTSFIAVNVAPTAAFTSSTTSGCAPHTVNFTDQSSPGSGSVTQWEWNFGDGSTSTQQNPSHTYTQSGTFSVFLKITNSGGCSNTVFKQQYVTVGTGGAANFTANVPNSCALPVTVSFVTTSPSDGTQTYNWNFGDGGTSTQQNPSHTYTNAGTFTVTLSIGSGGGCSGSSQQTITLANRTVSFDGPATVCMGTAANFTMTSNPAPVTQTWQMGDGISYTTPNISHTYAAPGTYQVSLTNEFVGGCIQTATKTVTVVTGPSVDFMANETASCKTPLTTTFQSTLPGASYQWSFGDGSTSTSASPTHTYQANGLFDVTLTVTGSNGCAATITKPQFIQIQAPTVAVSNAPETGCLPFSYSPAPSVNAVDGVAEYYWDFGDGGTSTNATPLHHYTGTGSYTLKLRIRTNKGCVDSVIYPNGITVNNGIPINFSASPINACVNQPVTFTPEVSGAESLTWYFGDGNSMTSPTAINNYKAPGKYNVTLVVTYGSCLSRLTKEEYINVSPPQASFVAQRDCNDKKMIRFTNTSVGSGNVTWDFGDGGTSTAENPVHTYSSIGDYLVKFSISNGICTDTMSKLIQVRNSAIIDFTASKTTLCRLEDFNFNADVISSANITSYTWIVPNSNVYSTTVNTASWYLYYAQSYDVTLVVTDAAGCSDTLFKPNYLTAYGPTPDFTIEGASGGCIGTNIIFKDSSATDGIHSLSQWSWDFGDNATSTQQHPSHAYVTEGRYSVTLTVTDNYGCAASISKPNFVNITNGKAGFFTSDSLNMGCVGNSFNFMDTSKGTIVSWFWDFGDGNTATDIQHPAHIYADSGVYTVKLRIRESSGCIDSVVKTNYVTIKKPKAAFELSDTFSTCPPLVVNFYDQSYYVRRWSWDFKDGGTSPIQNPVNTYFVPGTYDVTLTVTSAGGCVDSTSRRVRILGPYGNFNYTPLSGCTPTPVNYTITNTQAVKFYWDYADGIADSGTVATSSHVYNTGGRFVPKVILTDVNGCRVPISGLDTIYIEKTEVDFDADRLLFCDTGLVNFTNKSVEMSQGVSYQWIFGDGNSSNTFNATHNYASNGLYDVTLIAVTPLGCGDTLTKEGLIKIVKSPTGSINSADTLCKPASFIFSPQLDPDTSAITTWNWNFGNGQTSTQQNPAPQLFPVEGTYQNTLNIINSSGCSTILSKTVVVNPLPDVVILSDTTICRGNSAQLLATGAVNYTWINPTNLSCSNCPNPIANPTSDIEYIVQGTSALGCLNYDTVIVKVFQPYSLNLSTQSDSLCVGTSVQLKAVGAPMYTWSPATGLSATNIPNPTATPATTTTYTVTGTDSLGCFTDSATVNIKVLPVPTVDCGPDITLSAGNTITINPTTTGNVSSYSWSPSTGLSCTNCPDPTITAGDNITYILKVTSGIGCTATDKLNVIVTCSEGNVFVPNTFSPNGDGMNDVFYIRGKGLYGVKSLRIFNRWGEMVFEKNNLSVNDPSHGWDGKYKGQKSPTETYIYQLEVLCTNRQLLKYNGTLTLIE